MKNVTKFLTVLILCAFASCKGPQGDVGPAGTPGATGAAGTTGATGATGAAGKDGNANVVYSDWVTPTWTDGGEGATNYGLFQKSTANALLTQDAIDKGLVYVYIKSKGLNYNQSTDTYDLVDRISNNQGTSFFKIPGRTTNKIEDYAYQTVTANGSIGVNYLYITDDINRQYFVSTNGGSFKVLPEFAAGKGFTYYNNLVKDISQYRVMVVYGSTKGRLASSVDMNDYEAVKAYFKIKD